MRVAALTDDAILNAAEIIAAGGTVVYPTETAYALGADPLNAAAVRSVFQLKGRDAHKPLGLLAASQDQVTLFCVLSKPEEPFLRYWPGPLSLVLPIRERPGHEMEGLHAALAGGSTASIRVSGSSWARKLAEAVGHPIIATSANRSGAQELFSVAAIRDCFSEAPQPDLVLDGGELPEGPMSTVLQIQNGKPVVLRRGAVAIPEAHDTR